MPEFLGPVTLKDAYDPAIQIGPAKGVTQFSLSLFAQTTDPNNSYPALVQFWRYPWDAVNGFNINGDPILESGERFFAGNTQGALYRGVAGARLRNYVKGKNAVALAEIDFAGDPAGSGGTVSSAATTTGGTGGLSVNFLGMFNQTQWPPQNPMTGNIAVLADTYGNLTFQWVLEYQPALGPANLPWRPYNGATPQYAQVSRGSGAGSYVLSASGWAYTGNIHGGGTTFTDPTVQVPVAGNWQAIATAGIYDQAAAADTAGVGVSTTNTVAPAAGNFTQLLLTVASGARGSVEINPATFTGLAKGATLYGWLYSNTTNVIVFPSYDIGLRPVALANA